MFLGTSTPRFSAARFARRVFPWYPLSVFPGKHKTTPQNRKTQSDTQDAKRERKNVAEHKNAELQRGTENTEPKERKTRNAKRKKTHDTKNAERWNANCEPPEGRKEY